MITPEKILKKYWGYEAFRPLQAEIIESVLSGKDTLALLPTGGGKSLCFQVPALMNEGICLVISPLIALMKDQVENLKKKGIPALSVHSGMSFIEVKKTLQNAAYGNFKFLYVSPERLETDLFQTFISILKINLIAVDEAHCISQWGYDFRPSYLRIANLRKDFPEIPVLALTASATLEVQKDICDKLAFKKGENIFQQSFERPNLSYSVFDLSSRQNKLLQILKNVPGTGIVYCKSRRRTKEISELLNMNGISADYYHAGLTSEERNIKQENWINNQTRIIACTNAFGMGIDKPDVRVVIHYEVPDALENYYQEAGRAGRDGKKSYAVLFYNHAEIEELTKQSDIRYPTIKMIQKVYGALCNYFQLPSGTGEGLSYDFDINTFVKNFNLEGYLVNNVLKILEQEELITYSDQFFAPPKIVFTTNREELESFEKSYPQYDDILKALLRSYEGIFDYPAAINEAQLSKTLLMERNVLNSHLIELNSMGLIEYSPQKERPQVIFLHDRTKAENLYINEKNLLKRKLAFEKRVDAMIRYTENTLRCRSEMIAVYFNDKTTRRCGVCDNCIRDKNISISKNEFETISMEIQHAISESEIDLTSMYNRLPGFRQNKILKVLTWLQSENKIGISKAGFIRVKK
jgi:ATP-dependent DNA helicase RecQ